MALAYISYDSKHRACHGVDIARKPTRSRENRDARVGQSIGMTQKFTPRLPSLKARLGSRVNNPDLEIGKKRRDFWADKGENIIPSAAWVNSSPIEY
jgi:hypothetical protein